MLDWYSALPAFLASRYDIRLTDRFIRTELDGEEINFFGRATQDGEEINFFGRATQDGEAVIIVGEVKLRLDDRRKVETDRRGTGRLSCALEALTTDSDHGFCGLGMAQPAYSAGPHDRAAAKSV